MFIHETAGSEQGTAGSLPDGSANSTRSRVSTSALHLRRRRFAYRKLSSFHTKAETTVKISQDFPLISP